MRNLSKILEQHSKWAISEGKKGVRADLSGADLKGINLCGVDLSGAKLTDANLSDAYLSFINLRGADLRGVNLRDAFLANAALSGADLSDAILNGANLKYAFLDGAELSGASLSGANLRYAKLEGTKIFIPMACPEEGSFIGYKKSRDNYIVKLEILSDAKRCSGTGRKCRCSKARVLSITNLDGTSNYITSVVSRFDPSFVYKIGEIVSVPDFDEDRWNECSKGIHFFITREEAVNY